MAKAGVDSLIQRFSSTLNLDIHIYILFLAGVCVEQPDGAVRFRWVKTTSSTELTRLAHTIVHRVDRFLEYRGFLERDMENRYLAPDTVDEDSITPLPGH